MDSFVENKGTISWQKEQTGYMQSALSRPIDGVYVIATTNNPQFLRQTMIDRFMFKLYFGFPGENEVRDLLKAYLPDRVKPEDIKLDHKVSCRDIAAAGMKATTYDITDPDRISAFLNIPRSDEGYEEIIKVIGDDVNDYKLLRGGK